VFTFSNVLIIFIVIVILVIYRKFDSVSKNYTRVQALLREAQVSMENLVKAKIASLRDVGIEVDAQRQATETILNKIKHITDSLTTYDPKFDEIKGYMEKYESLLPQLIHMTENVEKNMHLIQDESEYIDTLGKRLSESQKKLQEIEQAVPQLLEHFERNNTRKLKEVEMRFFSSMETGMSALRETLESTQKKVDDSELRIIQFAQQVEDLQTEASQKLQESADQAQQSWREYLSEARMDSDRELEERKKEFSEQIEQLLIEQEEKLETMRNETALFQDKVTTDYQERQREFDDLLQNLMQRQSDSEHLLATFSSSAEQELQEKEKTLSISLERFIEKYAEVVVDSVSQVEEAARENIQKAKSVYQDFDRKLEERQHSLEVFMQEVESQNEVLLSKGRDTLEELAQQGHHLKTKALQVLKETFYRDIEKLATQLRSDMKSTHEELQQSLGSTKEKVVLFQSSIDNTVLTLSEEIHVLQRNFEQDISKAEQKSSDHLQSSMAKIEQDLMAQSQGFKEVVEQRIQKVKESIEQYYADLHERFQAMRTKTETWGNTLEQYMGQLETRVTKVEKEFREVESQQQRAISTMVEKTEDQLQTFKEYYQNTVEEARLSIARVQEQFQAVDKSLSEEKLRLEEDIQIKIKGVFTDLSQHITEQSEGVRGSVLQAVEAELIEYEKNFRYRLSKVEGVMSDMDRFEHEVQDFIQTKQEGLFEALKDLEHNALQQYAQTKENIQRQKEELSQSYTSLGQDIVLFYEKTTQKLEQRIADYESEVSGRLDKYHQTVDSKLIGVQNSIKQSLVYLEDDFSQQFKEAKDEFSGKLNQELAVLYTDISEQLAGKEGQINEFKELLQGRIRDAEGQIDIMYNQVLENIKSNKVHVLDHFNNEIEEQKEVVHQRFHDWQQDVVHMMDEFKEQMQTSLSDVEQKITSFEENMQDEKQKLLISSQEHVELIGQETEKAKEGLQHVLQLGREEFFQMKERLLDKLDQDFVGMTKNIERIEKRQKSFLEQTRLFERTDQLKTDLEHAMNALKADLDELREQRKWIRDFEAEINKMRRMRKETDQQFTRFLAEKRRIDMLESNYNHLVTLSYEVEKKLQIITSKDDEVQSIHIILKDITGLEREVEERFNRLEEKREVLDFMLNEIQKGVNRLDSFDRQLQDFAHQITNIPQQIKGLTTEITQLMEHKPQLDQAMLASNELGDILKELEERIAKLQVAREWLAGVETRMNELNTQVDSQLRTLQQLVKKDLVAKQDAAPSKDARRTVIQLARQGWNTEEIARVTKMSRGEIELILEMSDRK